MGLEALPAPLMAGSSVAFGCGVASRCGDSIWESWLVPAAQVAGAAQAASSRVIARPGGGTVTPCAATFLLCLVREDRSVCRACPLGPASGPGLN